MIKHEKKSLTSSEVLRLINESSKDGFDHNHLMGFIISQRIRTFIDFSGALFESDFVGGRERGSDSIVKPHGRQQVVNSFDLRIIHTYQTDTDMSEFLVAGIYSNKPLLLRGAFYHREEQKWDSALSVGDWGLSDKGFIKVFADSAGPMLKFDEMEIKTLWPKKVSGNPSTEVLQSENQHLHQEMEALKAEVEQLRAENTEPKQTRSNPVRDVMLDIVKRQPDIKTAEMWARIKEMADSQIWPFVHGGAEGEIKYEDGEKIGFLKKRNVGERLKRIKETC